MSDCQGQSSYLTVSVTVDGSRSSPSPQGPRQLTHILSHTFFLLIVQPVTCGLVQDEELGLVEQRHGEAKPPLLAPAELRDLDRK